MTLGNGPRRRRWSSDSAKRKGDLDDAEDWLAGYRPDPDGEPELGDTTLSRRAPTPPAEPEPPARFAADPPLAAFPADAPPLAAFPADEPPTRSRRARHADPSPDDAPWSAPRRPATPPSPPAGPPPAGPPPAARPPAAPPPADLGAPDRTSVSTGRSRPTLASVLRPLSSPPAPGPPPPLLDPRTRAEPIERPRVEPQRPAERP